MITVQKVVNARGVPSPARLRRYVRAALGPCRADITVRIVGSGESRRLNHTFRGKDKPTNVLSFSYERRPLQGDVVVCAPVVRREAKEQMKEVGAHWAHLVIHGVLHLRGYDHERPRDAVRMEARERAILARLRYPDPYLTTATRKSH